MLPKVYIDFTVLLTTFYQFSIILYPKLIVFSDQVREANKKRQKISQQLCTISKNGETPPPPISQQFQPLSELEN